MYRLITGMNLAAREQYGTMCPTSVPSPHSYCGTPTETHRCVTGVSSIGFGGMFSRVLMKPKHDLKS